MWNKFKNQPDKTERRIYFTTYAWKDSTAPKALFVTWVQQFQYG